MVKVIFSDTFQSLASRQTLLRKILNNASYETANLDGGRGSDKSEARRLVRLIKAATIDNSRYPLSRASRLRARHLNGIAVWENEGGSTTG